MAKAAATTAAKESPENKGAAEVSSEDFFGQLVEKSDIAPELQKVVDTVFGDNRKKAAEALVPVLKWATANTGVLSGNAREMLESAIGEIDRILTEQVNEIIHQPQFQQLEGDWRGLHRLVMNSELGTEQKIRVMNVSKDELLETFRDFPGAKWDKSPLFQKMYDTRFGILNGEPFGTFIGNYAFSNDAADVEVMRGMGRIAMHCHAPFIAGTSPKMFNISSWKDINKIPDPAMIFDGDSYAAWRSFRKTEESKYVGLTLPRVLARRPYGAEGERVKDFDFEEDVSKDNDKSFVWTNAAMLMGENINHSFFRHGWASEIAGIESGGVVKELPTHTFTTADGGQDMACPTEVGLPYAREYSLANLGFIPLCHAVGEDWAAFLSANSAHEPKEYMNDEDTKNSKMTSRLPYTYALSRFAHFLKKMVYLKVNSPMPRKQIELWLNNWIANYVLLNADNVSDYELLAQRPLSAAKVEVVDDPANPGMYRAVFYLQPHFRLERIDISLRLVSSLPKNEKK